jgi:hypothetical protein
VKFKVTGRNGGVTALATVGLLASTRIDAPTTCAS